MSPAVPARTFKFILVLFAGSRIFGNKFSLFIPFNAFDYDISRFRNSFSIYVRTHDYKSRS